MAQQQARTQQQIAADIAKQEVANERLAAQATLRMQQMEAQGDMAVQQQEFARESTLLGMSQQELAGARKARAEATSALGGMFGGIATAGVGAALGGAFGKQNTGSFNNFNSYIMDENPFKLG